MPRKTIEVKKLVTMVNDILIHTADRHKDRRIGAYVLLHEILHKTGNYQGFAYLDKRDMRMSDSGHSVGINGLGSEMDHDDLFRDTDDSRRFYS
jgi:hypothetical protein